MRNLAARKSLRGGTWVSRCRRIDNLCCKGKQCVVTHLCVPLIAYRCKCSELNTASGDISNVSGRDIGTTDLRFFCSDLGFTTSVAPDSWFHCVSLVLLGSFQKALNALLESEPTSVESLLISIGFRCTELEGLQALYRACGGSIPCEFYTIFLLCILRRYSPILVYFKAFVSVSNIYVPGEILFVRRLT
jgi:hypothetical protein